MSVTGIAGMSNIKKIVPELLPPKEVFAGIPARFRVSLHNGKAYLPSFLVSVTCSTGQSHIFPILNKKSTGHGSLLLTFNQRGDVPLGRITISSPYPVGFFTRYWSFESHQKVTVFPRPSAVPFSERGDESPAAGSGLRTERGLSGELERIYPYSGSEPLRMIHWKHSARSHELMVKGFGRTVAAPLLIDVESLPGQGIEERLSQAAWLITRWVQERPVGLLLGGCSVSPAMGRQHGLTLLKELAGYADN